MEPLIDEAQRGGKHTRWLLPSTVRTWHPFASTKDWGFVEVARLADIGAKFGSMGALTGQSATYAGAAHPRPGMEIAGVTSCVDGAPTSSSRSSCSSRPSRERPI